jgi:hypothetical protein
MRELETLMTQISCIVTALDALDRYHHVHRSRGTQYRMAKCFPLSQRTTRLIYAQGSNAHGETFAPFFKSP